MSCCYDVDAPEFYTEIWRKARKEHKCNECQSVIKKNEEYQFVSGKWDGYIDTIKTCEKCADLRESLSEVSCPLFYDLRECYLEYLNETGVYRYNEHTGERIYPENHMNLNNFGVSRSHDH